MADLVYSTETPLACSLGIPGCDCDRMDDGTVLRFCECHDCYICGAFDCDGHADESDPTEQAPTDEAALRLPPDVDDDDA